MEQITLAIAGKDVEIYPCKSPDSPVIYLNMVSAQSGSVLQELEKMGCPDFSLVAISNLEWEHDMVPWDIPPISPNGTSCTGGADEYLGLLLRDIIPEAEKRIQGVSWRGIAGYSLAGLFAVYAMYQTDVFSRIASMSGSLWFPGFKEYAMAHTVKKQPEHLYLSLGNRESKTKNPYLKPVQANTEELFEFYQKQQMDVEFVIHPGSHFTEPVKRCASGIQWMLAR